MATVYFLRATAQLGAAIFTTAIGLASAAPFLERLIQIYGRNRFLAYTHSKSTTLALNMRFLLRWCLRTNLYLLAASIALEAILPNELQHYLRHSTFRINTETGTPKTEEQELKNFYKAAEATL